MMGNRKTGMYANIEILLVLTKILQIKQSDYLKEEFYCIICVSYLCSVLVVQKNPVDIFAFIRLMRT